MQEIKTVELRHLQMSDYEQLRESMIKAYHDMQESIWSKKHIRKLLELFPEGQIVILADNRIVGCALTIMIDWDSLDDEHTYEEVTGNYTFSTHDPEGDILYGIDIFISPEYRGLRLGRRLYDARKELCEQLNLKGIVFGGRIPLYSKYADKLTPREYIGKVARKEIYDPVLSFQLGNDFHVKRILKDYLSGDTGSKEYATLMEWNNIYYVKSPKLINARKSVVRLGLVQWQMRDMESLEELYTQMEYFVDAVAAYNSDFALFPEFFNAPLMAKYNHMSESEAIRKLAEFTEEIRAKFQEFAISYNINIITGSMPLMEGSALHNVGYLCRRNGSTEVFHKIHITPSERTAWGMKGGDRLRTFDTDCGKIGVLICYDVEFPELSRIMAEQGMKILFVPFLTDTQNGFHRVKRCAQARAIENECYVAIAGSVGNLPFVHNMDIQFAQSAVFTPCDFAFPTNGIKAEATPNTEMVLVCDIDLDLLRELHQYGSVTNLRDRRPDLYTVSNTFK